MNPILTVSDLEVFIRHDHRWVYLIRKVGFSLYSNERLGLVGASGSGKTILMKALLGLLPSNDVTITGSILYKEKNLLDMRTKELQTIRGREIGLIFQDPKMSLNPTMKIGSQIEEAYRSHFPSSCRKKRREITLQILRDLDITDPELCISQYPHELSGGMRQRILIAMVLALRPQVLIADEPTTALDTTVQASIFDRLSRLQRNKSTLLISHDLALVASFCDRILILYEGAIVEEGEPSTLFKNPRHSYTQRLVEVAEYLTQYEPHFST